MVNGTINTLTSLVMVGLTTEDALKFKTFCQYYDQISCLLDVGVFERVRPGSVILHLSPSGEIGKIELHPVIVVNKRL